MIRKWIAGVAPVLAMCGLAVGSPVAKAQTTDGYHAIQVLPVVVDTASFTQRITIRNPNTALTLNIASVYYPADGTSQATPLACPELVVAPRASVTLAGLRLLCPGLAAGSQFGSLVLRTGTSAHFAVYSRVSNAAGAGFSVEGFSAQTFTSATTVVTGLRRLVATANSPAYQTNCFVGNLAEHTPGPTPVTSDITLKLYQDNVVIGQTVVPLPPGRLVRLLDVFGAAGLPDGDLDGVDAMFSTSPSQRPALLAFCTVQDNTSFGADFRIGKVERGRYSLAAQDYTVSRNLFFESDFKFSGEPAVRKFVIPAGSSRNVHSFYFRHPDVIDCMLGNAVTGNPATPFDGLEMRLLGQVAGGEWEVMAGGSDVVSFSGLYLGDKLQRGGGHNTRYMIEVESNGSNEAADRFYYVGCVSGSGSTMGEMVLTGAPVVF